MTATGTSEATWSAWPALQTWESLPLPRGRVVLVSAHPDDEVLAAGGLLAALADTAHSVSFVTVTDGEASHASSSMVRPNQLARRLRTNELTSALATIGHRALDVTRPRLPDSQISAHADELTRHIGKCVRRADLVICPARADGHPDHAMAGTVTAAVKAGIGYRYGSFLWIWHWTAPGDHGIPWERARRHELSAAQQRTKRAALECFTSQVRPFPDGDSATTILPPDMLEHFSRSFEVFFT